MPRLGTYGTLVRASIEIRERQKMDERVACEVYDSLFGFVAASLPPPPSSSRVEKNDALAGKPGPSPRLFWHSNKTGGMTGSTQLWPLRESAELPA